MLRLRDSACFSGPTANIRSINAKDLCEYLQNHYKASRIVVAGAGGVNHEELVKLTECHLGCLGKHERTSGASFFKILILYDRLKAQPVHYFKVRIK